MSDLQSRKSEQLKQPAAGSQIADSHPVTEARDLAYASQWRLMWIRFRRHKVAMVCGVVIALLYLSALFAEFVAPYHPRLRHEKAIYAPPQRIHFRADDGFHFRPFVYGHTQTLDPKTFDRTYKEDRSRLYPIHLFVRAGSYKLWGLFEWDVHLFGTKEGTLFIFGSDIMGRDMLSRIIHGGRISMSIGLIGVFVSFTIGLFVGGVSGYFGGTTDRIIQRVMEVIRSFPQIPLWMAFSAALPSHWSSITIYFAITIILSMIGWTSLARITRGKVLQLKNEDFVTAARLAGAGESTIIVRHLIPSFMSHNIAAVTLAIPQMILPETALSFLGVGLRAPVISWGVLLKTAQNVHAVVLAPWQLIPGFFIIVFVMAYNFLGDGLRDAADPYSSA